MRSLNGMSVLVTGGGSGIGEGCARHFAARGARVTISGRREDALQRVASSIGAACAFATSDITSEAGRAQMLETALRHGGGKLDVLINNAGNILHGNLESFSEQALEGIFSSNVIGPMLLTGQALPHLEKTQGAVMFVGSVHTRCAFPGRAPYAATKGAVQVLTRVLAGEFAPKRVRVNCVIPGAVPTEINVRAGAFDAAGAEAFYASVASSHPLGRVGTSTEIAEAMEYLVCAEWTTGAILDVDGGMGLGLSRI
jgi:3-oxoacyl-[acyl-carrier protein] reductase